MFVTCGYSWWLLPVLLDGQSRRFHLGLQMPTGQAASPPTPAVHCCHRSAACRASSHRPAGVSLSVAPSLRLLRLPASPALPLPLRALLNVSGYRSSEHKVATGTAVAVLDGTSVFCCDCNLRRGRMGKKEGRSPPCVSAVGECDGCGAGARCVRAALSHFNT